MFDDCQPTQKLSMPFSNDEVFYKEVGHVVVPKDIIQSGEERMKNRKGLGRMLCK